jgi:YD repeat-containing protein
MLASFALLASIPCLAQHTVTQDAGGGRKVELQYNAAGQITETRTLGPDGKILERDVLNYSPGGYVPQATSTSYWPNGKIHRAAQNTYDNNSNFTGEFIQVFDDSGKQTAGHRLTHDPQSNVYHCADWNIAAQDYKAIECPSGEESSGTPETVKKFTQEEVMQQLSRARQASLQPAPRTQPMVAPPGKGTNVREVGFILPSRIRAGERVSGSVVENPGNYEGQPEVLVTRIALPFAPSGAAATLAGWTLQLSGEPPRPADGAINLTIPPGQIDLAIMFRQVGNEGAPVSKAIPLPKPPGKKAKPFTTYQAPALCLTGQLCVVRGPFSGDSSKTFAAFDEHPAQIVAETSDSAYIAIPDRLVPGGRALAISEGSRAIAFPTVVASITFAPDRRDLPQGETLLMTPTLSGPEELPDAEWLPGNYPPSNLDAARKLIPGFKVPAADHEAHEKHEAEERREAAARQVAKSGQPNPKPDSDEDLGGQILLVIKNLTPEVATFRDAKNGLYVFHLTAASFKMGEFKYKFVVEANKTGNFGLQGYAIPFLAPITGQEFPLTSAAGAQP